MKTVKQYLKEIPDRSIRKKALRNLDAVNADDEANSLQNAISKAFIYKDTPEGEDYWTDVHFKYQAK